MTEREALREKFETWRASLTEEIDVEDSWLAWQASRQQALEEAAQQIESHKTGASLDLVMQGFANEVRHLSIKFHPTPSKGQP